MKPAAPSGGDDVTIGGEAGEGSLAGLGLVSYGGLLKGTSPITSTSDLAPGPRLDFGHDARPRHAGLSSYRAADKLSSPAASHLNRPTAANATGITGSVSPRVVLGESGVRELFTVADRVSGVQRGATLTPAGGGDSVFTANSLTVSQPGTVPGGDPIGGGEGEGGGTAPGGGGEGGPATTVVRDNSLSAVFTFSLDIRGSDSMGDYVLRETGNGTILNADPDAPGATGVVEVHRQFRVGPGLITAADPTTTESVVFEADGDGLVRGWDVDGYNAATYGISVESAIEYRLVVTGEDVFSVEEATTVHDPDPEFPTLTTAKFSSPGVHKYRVEVAGPGVLRSYEVAASGESTFASGQETATVGDPGSSRWGSYSASWSGSASSSVLAKGTVNPLGVAKATGYTVTLSSTGTGTSSFSGGESWDGPNESGAMSYSEVRTSSSSSTITVTGTGDDWVAEETSVATDAVTSEEAGTLQGARFEGGRSDSYSADWSGTFGGQFQESLAATVTGSGATSAVGSVSYGANGDGRFTRGHNSAAASVGPNDSSSGNFSHSATGTSTIALSVQSSDGKSFAASQQEAIANGFTDTGGGKHNYAETFSGGGVSGPLVGSGDYSDSGSGHQTVSIHSGGTLAGDGKFSLTGFQADLAGTAKTKGSDSGTAKVTVPGEFETSRYKGNSDATVTYDVGFVKGAGDDIGVTESQTVTGQFGDKTGSDSAWGGFASGGAQNDATLGGTRTRSDSDTSDATVTVSQSGTVGADGAFAGAGGKTTISGTATFNDSETLLNRGGTGDGTGSGFGPMSAGGTGGGVQTNNQTDTGTGTNKFSVTLGSTETGAKSLSVSEDLSRQLTLTGTASSTGGPKTVNGSINMSGPVNSKLSRTGSGDGEG